MAAQTTNTTKRVTLRLSNKDADKLTYWAQDAGVSVNEFIPMLVDQWASIKSGDYRLPTLEQARLNQLVDVMLSMSTNMQSLESVVTSGFDSLLRLTRGDNYLLVHEDGELGD